MRLYNEQSYIYKELTKNKLPDRMEFLLAQYLVFLIAWDLGFDWITGLSGEFEDGGLASDETCPVDGFSILAHDLGLSPAMAASAKQYNTILGYWGGGE